VPARLTLISHAPTPAQRDARFPADEPLEESSLLKLSTLNWQPPRANRVLTAPELRTQQTASALNLSATSDTELRDIDYSTWQGHNLNDLYAKDPEAVTQWLTDPSAAPHKGETIAHLIGRVTNWLVKLAALVAEEKHTTHTIAITHPAVIRAAILHSLNAPPQSFWRIDIAPLTLTDLRHNGLTWTLRSTAIPLTAHDSIETP
jgi:broad specificity phosphatase PhoE